MMIRRESIAGASYAVVELHNVRHIYVAAAPCRAGSLEDQTRDALGTIAQVIDAEGRRGSIVQQAVFLRHPEQQEACRRLIHEFYGRELPATTYIAQPPCDGTLLAIEALGVGQGRAVGPGTVAIQRLSEQLVVTRHSGVSWIHCSQITPPTAGSIYDRSTFAFGGMRQLLASAGVRFDQVIRTWLYLGGIVESEGNRQRYQELNRARSDFYQTIAFGAGHTAGTFQGQVYPASTGIGTGNGHLVLSGIAVASERDDLALLPLENPCQTSAFDYAAHYSPESPKFARAMALICGGCATIFVSGTASITGAESRHLGDVRAQTQQTLDNIETLISEANFRRHGFSGLGATLGQLALVRVYVKRPEDYAAVRATCAARLGNAPTIYAVADVCRPELLVEIEGIAFSQGGAG